MDERSKELVAIGASVSGHCQPCLLYHLGKARDLGAGEEDIQAAIEVGYMVENSASAAMKKYIGSVLNQAPSKSDPCCSEGERQ